MSYVDGFAKETGRLGEAEVGSFFRDKGLYCAKPEGKDYGIDRIVKFHPLAKKEARIQVKGRRQKANPRWFQLTVTGPQQALCLEENGDLNELWKTRINMVDFWVMVSIPLNEIWVFPSAIVFEITEANARVYTGRKDNDFNRVYFNKHGKIEKKQKELNLNITDESGTPLYEKYSQYRDNLKVIIDFLNG
jgi:hypothetical protein